MAMVNRLANATSPYLQQHAGNPVDWWEWGPDAFAEARRRDTPIFLSVGYAACHWCHVRGLTLRNRRATVKPQVSGDVSSRHRSRKTAFGRGFRESLYHFFVSPWLPI